MTAGRAVLLVLIVALGGYLLKPVIFPSRVPPMDLEVNTGGTANLLDLGGKEMGILLYVSNAPGNLHPEVMRRNLAAMDGLKDSKKYHVTIVYGEGDGDAVKKYVQTITAPVLMDPGKQLAKAMGFNYFGIVVYKDNGKVLKQLNEGYFTSIPTSDDHVDAFLK